jgi:hypothetical protein
MRVNEEKFQYWLVEHKKAQDAVNNLAKEHTSFSAAIKIMLQVLSPDQIRRIIKIANRIIVEKTPLSPPKPAVKVAHNG